MAERDHLTHLPLRAAMEEAIDDALRNAAEQERIVSIAMIDLDHFKNVNDEHGHSKGDDVLVGYATLVDSVARGKADCYRYGGEELVVVFPNSSLEEALATCERIRTRLEDAPIAGIRVSASIGLATLGQHGSDRQSLLLAADAAMYDAKRNGRNLVRYFGEPAPARAAPRIIERKEAKPGGLSDDQKDVIRRKHFRRQEALCPNDEIPLRIKEIESANGPLLLRVTCPMCDVDEGITAREG